MSLHGIILLDKPAGLSSNDALKRAKFILGCKKAGHTGSLDPIATGMLPLCLGEATKFSRFLLEAEKTYLVTAVLGIKTNTGDIEGEILSQLPAHTVTEPQVVEALSHFLGKQTQIPPMFSALKHKGQPLYKLARQGIEVERKPRDIEIYAIELLDMKTDLTTQTARVRFSVSCSKGTYVRTLVEDLGQRLGVGAHVSGLHRTSVGPFKSHLMYSLEDIVHHQDNQTVQDIMIPIESALMTWPVVRLSASSCYYLQQGQPVRVPDKATDWVRILSQEGRFLGVGEMLGDGRLAPRRLLQS